ncbi:hypothetical protein J6590_042358 [Homalodisca vitripennis]|nr:hypothetical protein J6590_042358 [Homalodisca vitripennis]
MRHEVRTKKPRLKLNMGAISLMVTSVPSPTAWQASCLQGQDRSEVSHPSSSHVRRCVIWLPCDNRRSRYTAPLAYYNKTALGLKAPEGSRGGEGRQLWRVQRGAHLPPSSSHCGLGRPCALGLDYKLLQLVNVEFSSSSPSSQCGLGRPCALCLDYKLLQLVNVEFSSSSPSSQCELGRPCALCLDYKLPQLVNVEFSSSSPSSQCGLGRPCALCLDYKLPQLVNVEFSSFLSLLTNMTGSQVGDSVRMQTLH